METLFIVCPDCFLEKKIREQYGGKHFFLTALGIVFERDISNELLYLIRYEGIKKIYIVSSSCCSFIQKNINHRMDSTLKVDSVLSELKKGIQDQLLKIREINEKASLVALKNIYRLGYEITENDMLRNNLRRFNIELIGLILNKNNEPIQEINLSAILVRLKRNDNP
ncbi:hypothetical protein [Flexithrix dorotheae]|uniref:hypothetical protein n=1 Tax=Flexithrix dorotheae TaxID=70993 RepID=UPI000377055D|nr:hypothetical protein [Flexithrix dorotheae]